MVIARDRTKCASCIILLVCLMGPLPADGQMQIGKLLGTVADPSGAAVPNAQLVLSNPVSGRRLQTVTDDQGQFGFENLPYGSYLLAVSAAGFKLVEQSINIKSNVPVKQAITLTIAAAKSEVEVVPPPELSHDVPGTETTIDESYIRFTPTVNRRDQLQALIATTPGWNTENDGLMHIRGVDDGTLYVVGGVPTPDRLDGLFAGSPDTDAISSLNIITGNIPAEFGGRSGAVVLVQPKSGIATPLAGTLSLGQGSFNSQELSGNVEGGTKNLGVFLAGAEHRSERFLDPIDPRNFNNTGTGLSFELHSDWNATNNDVLRLAAVGQGSNFDVPDTELQEEAGQRERQQVRHDQESIFWQHTWSANTLTDAAYFRNFFHSSLDPSPFDTPLTAEQNRHHSRQGLVVSLTHVAHGHTIKAGAEGARVAVEEAFAFSVTDPTAAAEAGISGPALDFTAANPFQFAAHKIGGTEAAYLQDDFTLVRHLRINAGLRYDHSNLLVSDQQFSPRIGGSYYLPLTHTWLRASFNRLYMPPQVENLLIASSQQARALSPFAASGGGADIAPEKLSAWETGVLQMFPGSLQLSAAYWWRHFKNIDDPNVLLNTTIIFPNSVSRADAKGVDLRLDIPARKGFSAHFSYSNSTIVEIGPINGGLFLTDDFLQISPGTRFTPDHDQRNAASFSSLYTSSRRGIWTSFSGRYESGVPIELPDLDSSTLHSLPGAQLVNFATGRVKPWYVLGWSAGMDIVRRERFVASAQLDVQNLTNSDFVFNWGNPFSGTHFGYPRLIAGRLNFHFKHK
jgi:TonB dependent receptor-like, beta-barrel/Carboxypeptidase regulatory-like domain